MKVKLIEYTPNPERVIASAAKLCYSNAEIETLMCDLTDDKIESFVKMLINIRHESPLEHASFTFGIEGVSRAFLAQITRHRIASFSVQSQRYVNLGDFDFVIPPEIEHDYLAKEKFINIMKQKNKFVLKKLINY